MTVDRQYSRPEEAAEADAVAIIGMAGRFPGAPDIEALWQNLRAGVESISRFSAQELLATGQDPAVLADPRFVGAGGVLDDIESFDAAFFGYSPREAAIMDPQHRLGLEVAWHAFEDAGYDPQHFPEPVGAFVSAGLSSYLVRNLLPDSDLVRLAGGFPLLIHNDKDFAATTIAHKLGLHGPALAVGTACSSSLVAVHLACQSLQTCECDMALAGGVSLQVPQRQGYVHSDDSIYSADGRCRPFDAKAGGTVGGSGVAMVVLKRLRDALRDGDRVHAVILGTAVNNNGGSSVGYTAPSVAGQAAVVTEALHVAGVAADSIGYIEAHGTGTAIGDPLEVESLLDAFRPFTHRTNFCAIGSVKANLGHLDAAAGVAGLVKAALTVKHGRIPPHPNFIAPNPRIPFDESPFYVNTREVEWAPDGRPRRAGVSSFGIGGTNAHVILTEPPRHGSPVSLARPWRLLTLSARSEAALDSVASALAERVRGRPDAEVRDVAYTLATRSHLSHRRAVVCRDGDEAAAALAASTAEEMADVHDGGERTVVFMFPGHGAQHSGMAAELYRAEPDFAAHLDRCADLRAEADVDLLGSPDSPVVAQAALFSVEYALAQTLLGWGLRPRAVIGHSLGEYVAATMAGALSLDDALRLVIDRARLQEKSAPGGMLAVRLPEDEVTAWLDGQFHGALSLAAANAPDSCVVAGPVTELDRFAAALERMGVTAHRLPVNRAYHSALLDPVLADFTELARDLRSSPVRLGWISTYTGEWMARGAAPSPDHWPGHMRQPVRFDAGIRRLLGEERTVFLEVGPSTTLSAIVRRHPERTSRHVVIECQPHPERPQPQLAALFTAVAKAWVAGCDVDLPALHSADRPRRTDAPLYPFQRERHWVDAPVGQERSLPPLHALMPNLEKRLGELAATEPIRGLAGYPGLCGDLDELCAALALRYFSAAGVDTTPGARHSTADLRKKLRIQPQYDRFADYLFDLLGEDGILTRHDNEVLFLGGARPREPSAVATELKRRHPGFSGLADLLLHCGDHLDLALSTPGAALGVLYPDGRGDLLRRTLGEETVDFSVTGRLVRIVAGLVAKVVATGPRPLRILEVGAGGGRLTWEIAEVLRGKSTDYVVTDIGRAFIAYLSDEAARRNVDIHTRVFDICRAPHDQGFATQSFDMVVGLDVVHATPDIPAALTHLRGLLAPGGLLVLIESVAQDRWQSMVWGLSDEWWGFQDGLRERTPLLRPDQWEHAIAEPGFAATAVLTGAPDDSGDAVVVLAQATSSASAAARAPSALTDLPEKRPDITEWCYIPGWQRSVPAVSAAEPTAGTPCLVFTDGPLGDAVIARLRQRGLTVYAVRPGLESRFDQDGCTLASARPEDYKELLQQARGGGEGSPRFVAHLWNVGTPAGDTQLERLEETQQRGLFSLLSLVQALTEQAPGQPVRLLAVTSHAQDVLGGELLAPERSTVHAAIKVIPREYPQISCGSLDIPDRDGSLGEAERLAGCVVDELFRTSEDATVAYRGRTRWVPSFTPWRLAAAPTGSARPRPGGIYLICGGLGGIGLSLAEHLAGLPAKVVVTRRTPFPPRLEWASRLTDHPADDPDNIAISRLLAAEARGGEALVLQADVTSLDDMRTVVARTNQRFGKITGVVHAAGVLDTAGMIQRRTTSDTWQAIAAKVRGPLVIDRVLRDQDLEFTVFCSSIGTVLHKLKFGEVGYVAGNEFLNAYATYRAARGDQATVAISWTDWLEAGMWAESRKRLSQRYAEPSPSGIHPTDDLLRGLTTAEGVEVFRRVLAEPASSHVVISTQDLTELLIRHAAFTHADHVQALETMKLATQTRGRPELGSDYVAPRTAAERTAAAIWESLLGIDGIGVHDDFFALGGDSLLALRFLARLREDAGVERTVAEMFEQPTLAGLLFDVGPDPGGPLEPTRRDEVVL